MPESGSKFIASYGFFTILDPYLIFLVDIFLHNYSCPQTYATCREDYTSATCNCFSGDFIKLWYRMERDEGSGITGLIILIILYVSMTVASCLLFYEYLLHVHKDARILDLWRRINAPSEEFFIPHDFEITHEELLSICTKAQLWRGANGATRRLVVSDYVDKDPYDVTFKEHTKHYAIYEQEMINGVTRKTLYRHFLLLPDGSIIEIFEDFDVDLTQHAKALNKLLGLTNIKLDNGVQRKKMQIFKGLETA